jgi:hypothetical protein
MVGDEAVYHPTPGRNGLGLAPACWACWPCPAKHEHLLIMILILWWVSAFMLCVSVLHYVLLIYSFQASSCFCLSWKLSYDLFIFGLFISYHHGPDFSSLCCCCTVMIVCDSGFKLG